VSAFSGKHGGPAAGFEHALDGHHAQIVGAADSSRFSYAFTASRPAPSGSMQYRSR
jgi:hypothetical protein